MFLTHVEKTEDQIDLETAQMSCKAIDAKDVEDGGRGGRIVLSPELVFIGLDHTTL